MDIQTGRVVRPPSPMESLEKQLSCPICLEMFTKPVVILPCQHNLCRGCASDLYDSRNPYHYSGGVFRCPTCRFEVSLDRHGVYGLQRNLLVENIIDLYKQQQEQKGEGGGGGGGGEGEGDGTLDPPLKDRDSKEPACAEHPEERINIYCLTCQTPTCSMCKVFGQHKDCEVSPLHAVYQSQKAELRAAVEALGDANAVAQAVKAQMEESCTTLRENAELQKRRLGESFDLLYAVLEERKGQLLERVAQEEGEKVATLRSLVDGYKLQLEAGGRLRDTLTQSAEKSGAAEFLVGAKELIKQARDTARGPRLERPEPGFEKMEHLVVDTDEVQVLLAHMDFRSEEEEEEAVEEEEEAAGQRDQGDQVFPALMPSSWPPRWDAFRGEGVCISPDRHVIQADTVQGILRKRSSMENKLDLSRLTDEEAKHVWDVIQRDFNLRKAEEDRLGELKTKIEKEDTKRELLGSQANLADSHCIRCLQPFKFLINNKRQCLDCQLYTCKGCSRYNKKEHGWVCDNCRMTRVLKIGTLGWYHDNVRNRFKRFGSAKVMRSLYKRLNGDGGRDDDTQSMPDVGQRHTYNGVEDDHAEAEAQRYKMMRKNKRLLSVHPMDFDPEEYYPPYPVSRRQSFQQYQDERGGYRNDLEYQNEMHNHRMNRRKSLDRYAMRPEDYARSLSKISSSVARQQYVDTSDEEDMPRYAGPHQPAAPFRRRNSKASSQENLGQPPPINELSKRMSAIESLLNRLEEKMVSPDEEDGQKPPGGTEEEKLRRKLRQLAGNLSDKGLSSGEEEAGKKLPSFMAKGTSAKNSTPARVLKDPELSSSSDEIPTEGQKVYVAAGKSFELETKLKQLEHNAKNRFGGGATDSDLSELEDVVAKTAARVQSTESEVSDIESKIAALNTVGLDKKKKISGSQQRKRSTQDPSARSSNGSGSMWRPPTMH
ncbi:unnamed protein product [Arctogadus glacialis]